MERRRARERIRQQQEELRRREEEYQRREEEFKREVLRREEERRREREHMGAVMRLQHANGLLEGRWRQVEAQRAEQQRVDAMRARQEAERARREEQQRLLERDALEDAQMNAILQGLLQPPPPPQSDYHRPWGY